MIFVCCINYKFEWNPICRAGRIKYGSYFRNMSGCWMIFICIIRRNCILGISSNIFHTYLLYMFNPSKNTCLPINWLVRISNYKNDIFCPFFIILHYFLLFRRDDYTNMLYFEVPTSFCSTYNSIYHSFYISYNRSSPSNTNYTFSSLIQPISTTYVSLSKSYTMIRLTYFVTNDHHQYHNNYLDSIHNVQVQGIMDNLWNIHYIFQNCIWSHRWYNLLKCMGKFNRYRNDKQVFVFIFWLACGRLGILVGILEEVDSNCKILNYIFGIGLS